MADHYEVDDSASGDLNDVNLTLLASEKMVRVTFTGTYTGAAGILKGSHDGTNYVTLSAMREDTGGMVTGTIDVGASNFSLIANVAGWRDIKFDVTAVSTGTLTVRVTGGNKFELPLGATAISITSIASTITSSSANALAVGANGTTNPVLKIDASASSVATGLHVAGAAAASGVGLTVLSSGTDESLIINAKGAGEITLNATGTGDIVLNRATRITDALDIMFGTGEDAVIRWSTGDADNHALVIGVENTNQSLHITDKAAVATDWNISATTHPNLYIHSDTTPATNYLRIGSHDGTTVDIDVVGGTTMRFCRAGTAEYSYTASQFNILDANNLLVGGSTLFTVGGTVPTFQVAGTTTAVDGSGLFITASTTDSAESEIKICKSGNASLGSFTTVAQSENLGSIVWNADDGTDYATVAARIRAVGNAAGTFATSRTPADLVFYTDPGGGDDAVREGMRLGLGAAGGGGVLYIGAGGTVAHAGMTGPGIVINQAGHDVVCFVCMSSDVTTGLSTIVKGGTVTTNDYFSIAKAAATTGGAYLQSLAESTATESLFFEAWGGAPATTDTSGSLGAMNFFVGEHNGANADADMAANSNAMVWGEIDSNNARLTRMLLKADDGELHLGNSTLVALDNEDDVQLVRAMQKASASEGIKLTALDNPFYDYEKLRKLGLAGEKDSSGFFLFPLQSRLHAHEGAIWQTYLDLVAIAAVLTDEQKARLPERVRGQLALAG